jgi:hypothetical protein
LVTTHNSYVWAQHTPLQQATLYPRVLRFATQYAFRLLWYLKKQ